MSYLKDVTKITIVLLFIISVFSLANTVSASLYLKNIEASAGIKDFRTINDTVSFNLSSTSEIKSINNNAPSCQKDSLNYYCSVTDQQNTDKAIYTIINQEGDSTTATINVDNSIGDITYSIANENGNITLNYDMTDTGYDNSALCSGIGKVEIWWQGSSIDTVEFNSTNCKQIGKRVLPITDSGTSEFYLDVYDILGNNKKSQVQNLTIDVSSPEISNLDILNNGLSLNKIAQNTDFLADLLFVIKEQNLSSVTADISNINTNPAIKQSYKGMAPKCVLNISSTEKIYNCVINSVVLRTNKESINITITAKDTAGNSAVQSLEKSFEIDNVIPQVTTKTEFCDTEKCYVKNGVNKIFFELTKNNFEKKQLYYEVGGVFGKVMECKDNKCNGLVLINCNGPIEAKILTQPPFMSQDDSGNKLAYFSKTLYCDNSPPAILNTTWLSNSKLANNLLLSGASFTLIAEIDEPDSIVIAKAFFDKMKNTSENAQCKRSSSGLFNCTWIITGVENGFYEANVVIDAFDAVNNTVRKSELVKVFGLKTDNSTPNSLKASYTKTVPKEINRVTAKLAENNGIPMYAYAYYTVSSNNNDAVLLSQDLSVNNCIYRDSKGNELEASAVFSDITLADKFKKIGDNHRIDFTFSDVGNYNGLDDKFRIICNVSAYVREGKYVYAKPQILKVDAVFAFRNSQLDAPGEQFVKKIKETEQSVNSTTAKLVRELDSVLVTVQNFCSLKTYLDYAQITGVAVQTAGIAMGTFLPGSKEAMTNAGGKLYDMGSQFNSKLSDPPLEDVYNPSLREPTGTDELFGFVGQACSFMSCDLGFNKNWQIDGGIAKSISSTVEALPLGKTLESDLTDSLTASDMKNSMIMSITKLCLPGVIYNLNKYQQLDCEYLQCLKVYSATGLDVRQCEVMKSTKTCAIYVGEAFEVPGVRIIKNLFSNTADIIRMSYGYGLVSVLELVKTNFKCEDVTSDEAILACNLPHSIQEYLSGQKKSRLATQFYYQKNIDFCKIAECVGPSCYSSNSLLGIPLPQYVPNQKQKEILEVSKRYGEMQKHIPLLIDAHASQDPTIRKEKIEDWNEFLKTYSDDVLGREIPELPADQIAGIDTDTMKKGNELISNYVNNFDIHEDYKANDKIEEKTDASKNPLLRPSSFKQRMMISENRILGLGNKILNPEYNFGKGTPKIRTFKDVVLNTPQFDPITNYDNLEKLLPKGDKGKPLEVYDGVQTNVDEYYYFDNNKLMYYKKATEKDTEIKNQVAEFDIDGKPKSGSITDLKYETLKKKVTDYETNKKQLDDELQNYEDLKKGRAKEKLRETEDFIIRTLLGNFGLDKFLTAEYWRDKWPGGEFITGVADAANPERWKNSLCNPENSILLSGDELPEGTALSCDPKRQGCEIVLSYGAEYAQYFVDNKTKYLYTLSYILGPVDHEVKYNVLLRGNQGKGPSTIKGFNNTDYVILSIGQREQKAKAFLLDSKFTDICFVFQSGFPEKGDEPREYCRKIKDDIFKTGKPVASKEVDSRYGNGFSNSNHASGGFLE